MEEPRLRGLPGHGQGDGVRGKAREGLDARRAQGGKALEGRCAGTKALEGGEERRVAWAEECGLGAFRARAGDSRPVFENQPGYARELRRKPRELCSSFRGREDEGNVLLSKLGQGWLGAREAVGVVKKGSVKVREDQKGRGGRGHCAGFLGRLGPV